MGPQFTIADIQMSYVLEMARHAGLLSGHPALVRLPGPPESTTGFREGR